MNIDGKVHCFFEQSGTFKNEFIKLGIPAEDYDIQDNFGQTDHVVDLFAEIEKAYGGGASVFDNIKKDDLIIAFYPCIYFSCLSQMAFTLGCTNYKKLGDCEKIEKILIRSKKRQEYYDMLLKFVYVCLKNGIRMVFENPFSMQHYLRNGNFLKQPTLIDENRMLRGDCYMKKTGYWFWNCEPTYGESFQEPKLKKLVIHAKKSPQAGVCSEERSMISTDYARNFICDFILGKKQNFGQISLF